MFNSYNPNQNRHPLRLHCLIRLQAPLSHIGESIGNQSNLREEKIIGLEGKPAKVFVYSGNALRGKILRREGCVSFLSQLRDGGLAIAPNNHQTLFSGGYIDGSTGNDLDLDREIRTKIPALSVLGTAKPCGVFGGKDAQMIAGRINVGGAYLVCLETAEYIYRSFAPALPYDCLEAIASITAAKDAHQKSWVDSHLSGNGAEAIAGLYEQYQETLNYWLPYLRENLKPYKLHLTERQHTRQDSIKSPDLRQFLLTGSEEEGQLSLLPTEKPKKEKKEAKSSQMIMQDWLLQKGSTLYSRWDANITDIEEGYIVDALLKFSDSPYLGGKGNTGCGLVSLQFYWQSKGESGEYLLIDGSQQVLSDRAQQSHARYTDYLEQYRSYLESNEGAIAGFLS